MVEPHAHRFRRFSSKSDAEKRQRFEWLVLPHLDAGYNLARWLTQNEHDAQDVVQESLARAVRDVPRLRPDGARAWLLQIVRHTCVLRANENRTVDEAAFVDVDGEWQDIAAPSGDQPPAVAMREKDKQQIDAAIAGLPVAYREVLVLRELEDLSYAEIARITDIPVETVMSRLSRARSLTRLALTGLSTPRARPQRPPLQRSC